MVVIFITTQAISIKKIYSESRTYLYNRHNNFIGMSWQKMNKKNEVHRGAEERIARGSKFYQNELLFLFEPS